MGSTSLKIALCDDDAGVREQLSAHCGRLCEELGIACELELFTDGDELVSRYGTDTDLLFLDVEMPLLDGMSAAHEIRRRDAGVTIVRL